MADSPILDYYRGSDHGCQLRRIGENYIEDTYAIGMSKGFPLKESISALIAKYSSNGYLDILLEKWYGGLPCYRDEDHIEIVQPRPLGVAAVAGVYLMLGLGMILGVLILVFEHLFFKYYLPILRHQPKGSIWRSRNVMFFSQVSRCGFNSWLNGWILIWNDIECCWNSEANFHFCQRNGQSIVGYSHSFWSTVIFS